MIAEKYRILIFDDDIALSEMLSEYLHNTNECVAQTTSLPEEFWSLIASAHYDLVLLDYRMPETNGLVVLAEMAARGINVPTVMMTGEGNQAIAARAIQSGAFDYLVKGQYSFSALLPLIQKAVRHHAMQTAMGHTLAQVQYQAALLNNMRDAVVVWDLEGHITYWNSAAEALYGATAADRLNQSAAALYFPSFCPPLSIPETLPGGALQVEHQYNHPDGKTIWISSQVSPLRQISSQDTSGENLVFGFMDVARDITPRKLEQEALLQSQSFVQHILDTSPNIIYILDLASRQMRYINAEVLSILGYAPDVFMHQPFDVFEAYLHPEVRASFDRYITGLAALQEGEVSEIEYRFMSSRKEWRWLKSRSTLFSLGASGQPPEIIGVIQDITNSKRAQQELEQRLISEKILSSISTQIINASSSTIDQVLQEALLQVSRFIHMDYALVMLFEHDRWVPCYLVYTPPAGRFAAPLLTEAACGGLRLGWLLERMQQHNTVSLNSIADLPAHAQDERELVQRMGSGPATFIPLLANKRLFGVLGFGTRHPGTARSADQQDMLQSFSEMITNALVQKQINKALNESEGRYRAIVEDHQTEMICRFLPDTTMTFVNEAYCRYYHQERSQLIGTSFLALVPPVEREHIHSLLANVQFEQPVQIFEQRIPLSKANLRWQEWTARAIFDDNRQLFEFQAIGRDITERKHMEEQVQIAQTHLTQSVRLASIGELASGVAHQISNPLTTIIADAQILRRQLEPLHPGQESADAILQAGWRAQEVINALMKFSQPEQKYHEQVSVNDTIEKALLLTSAHIHSLEIKLNVEMAADLPVIRANPRQLTDLWVNLLLLARSACDDGEKHSIRIRSRRIKEWVVVDINDDGRPVPREQFDTIFEPQMLPSGSWRGTGMELSLCREIARQNEGRIEISGSSDETTFRVTFSTEGSL